MDVLMRAEEVFITASTRDIQPVHRVDDRALAAPGRITAAVMDEFALRSGADSDP